MTKRSRRYFAIKRTEKWLGTPMGQLSSKVKNSIYDWGMAGTRVWKDESGNVRVKVLTLDEILDLQNAGGHDRSYMIYQ